MCSHLLTAWTQIFSLKVYFKVYFLRAQSHTDAVQSALHIQTFDKKKALEFGHNLSVLQADTQRSESNLQPVRFIDLPVFPVNSIFFYLFPNLSLLTVECLLKLSCTGMIIYSKSNSQYILT